MHQLYGFLFLVTATIEIYTLSLHDALPILGGSMLLSGSSMSMMVGEVTIARPSATRCCCPPESSEGFRSEEHTSELQSQSNLVCRLLLEKKKNKLSCLPHSP